MEPQSLSCPVNRSDTPGDKIGFAFIEGWRRARTGQAPADEASFSNLKMSKPFILGALVLALTCIYHSSDSFEAYRSAGPLLPLENFTSQPLDII